MISCPQITVLGSGTSAGVPAIGCDCATCTSSDPRDTRTRTGAAVEWIDPHGQHRLVLIDAGPDFRQQALRHDLRRCDALLVTHNHTDHIFGIDELRRFNAIMEGHPPIAVYAEPRCWTALRRVYQHVMEKQGNVNPSFVASLIAHEIEELPYDGGAAAPIDLWGMRFTPIRVLHGKLPILAYRIEPTASVHDESHDGAGRQADEVGSTESAAAVDGAGASDRPALLPAAWVTDTSAVPPRSWSALGGVNTLFADGLRHRRHPTHFTLDEAQDFAQRVGPQRTFFIHIAHEVLHERDEPALGPGVRLAVDGLILRHGDADAPISAAIERGPRRFETYRWADTGVTASITQRLADIGARADGRADVSKP